MKRAAHPDGAWTTNKFVVFQKFRYQKPTRNLYINSMNICKTQRFRHADVEHVAWRKVENEAVVLDLDTSEYCSLNETGVFIWEKIGQGASIDQICQSLLEEYEDIPEDMPKQVVGICEKLLKAKLIYPIK